MASFIYLMIISTYNLADDCLHINRIIGATKSIGMNYDRMGEMICEKYGVRLVGWPEDIPITNPGHVKPRAKLQELVKALEDGHCRWEVVEESEATPPEVAPAPKPKRGKKRKAAAVAEGEGEGTGQGDGSAKPKPKAKKRAKKGQAAVST